MIKERIDNNLSINQVLNGIQSLEEKLKILMDKVLSLKDREVVVQQSREIDIVAEKKKQEKIVTAFVPSVDVTDLKIQAVEPVRKKKSGVNIDDSLEKLSEM